ncbi:hypothetical protein NM208_g1921 [Fusarium decemcellulare]|uniref:Uncharacterized protein n=1 Tax=Fusarium decemcellulare TaxID=57161 RepID=A0ACC1SUI1_9HYPO|nr:hypothetical protein NM208_g1921 [Fusarium decemcellulare]
MRDVATFSLPTTTPTSIFAHLYNNAAQIIRMACTPVVAGFSSDNGNLTVAFFANEEESSCQANDTSKGLVLTTSSIPTGFTCFNVKDIFSQSNDTGFQNATQRIYDSNWNLLEPNGIHWLLRNRDDFDSKANYSRTLYEQVNETGEIAAGEAATWVFYIYAFEDCAQVGGEEYEYEDYPWVETSCQTKEGGQCQTLPYSIKSFGINSATEYNHAHGQCEIWALMGASTRLNRPLFASLASVGAATFFLLL